MKTVPKNLRSSKVKPFSLLINMASSLNEYLSAKNSNGLPSTPENLFNQQQSHQNYNHPQQSNHINGRLSRTPSTRRKAPSPMLAHDLCATPQAGMGSVGNFIKPSPQQSADMEYYSDEEDPMISMKNNNWFFEKQQTTEVCMTTQPIGCRD